MRPAMNLPPRLALALLLALPAACSHAPSAGGRAAGPDPAEYFPLAVGNSWTWEDRSPQLPAGRPALRTVRITERTADGFFRDSERGELKLDGDCLRDRSRQLLCAPLDRGHSWMSVLSVRSTEKYEIAGVGEVVDTPAGVFKGCLRVRALNNAGPGTDLVNEITYAPGVGPVRIETFAVVDGAAKPQFLAVLRAYHQEGK